MIDFDKVEKLRPQEKENKPAFESESFQKTFPSIPPLPEVQPMVKDPDSPLLSLFILLVAWAIVGGAVAFVWNILAPALFSTANQIDIVVGMLLVFIFVVLWGFFRR